MLRINIKYASDDLPRLNKIHKGDWIDLYASEDIILKQGEFTYIPLGVYIQLPKGYEAYIAPRSSTFKNFGIIQPNSPGIVDESYRGPDDMWRMPAYCLEAKDFVNGCKCTHIHKGDKICQFRIQSHMPEIDFIEIDDISESESRGGFGSTGLN